MSGEPEITDDLKQLEATLRSLCPQPANLDHEQIFYEAGRAAGLAQRPTQTSFGLRWLGAATAALLLLSITTTALWLHERGTDQVVVDKLPREESVQPDEMEAATLVMVVPPPGDYFALRQMVLEQGVDALPPPTSGSGSRGAVPSMRDAIEGI